MRNAKRIKYISNCFFRWMVGERGLWWGGFIKELKEDSWIPFSFTPEAVLANNKLLISVIRNLTHFFFKTGVKKKIHFEIVYLCCQSWEGPESILFQTWFSITTHTSSRGYIWKGRTKQIFAGWASEVSMGVASCHSKKLPGNTLVER